jgi:hypothetical protein
MIRTLLAFGVLIVLEKWVWFGWIFVYMLIVSLNEFFV